MAAAKKKSRRKSLGSKSPSQSELDAADSYAAILRWIVDTSDRIDSEYCRLKSLPEAMRALQHLGAYGALAGLADEHQIKPVPGSNLLGHRPYDEVVFYFEEQLNRIRSTRESWLHLLSLRKPPDALYAHVHNMKVHDVSNLRAEDVVLQREAEKSLGLPLDREELQLVSDRWFALAVESLTKSLGSREDNELLEDAARCLYWAREAWWDYKSEQTVDNVRRHVRHEEASDYGNSIRSTGQRIASLFADQRVKDARRGLTNRGKGGEKSAAHELIAMVSEHDCTARIVEDAVARQRQRREAKPSHMLW